MSLVFGSSRPEVLLSQMKAVLHEDDYVFVSVPESHIEDLFKIALAYFRENEGLTFILKKTEADERALATDFTCKLITIEVHSSLQAIGFLAPICQRLAAAGIAVNIFSAFYSNHILIPSEKANEAILILESLRSEALSGELKD